MDNRDLVKEKEIIKVIYTALNDKFGIDIKIIDVTKVSTVSDYFIITSGNNKNQIKALADEVTQKLYENKVELKKSEGYEGDSWILLDFGFVMVHIFSKESREFYDLEKLWEKGELLNLEEL